VKKKKPTERFELVQEPVPGGGSVRKYYRISCSRCPNACRSPAGGRGLPEDVVKSNFQHQGWRVSPRNKHVCPSCQKLERKTMPTRSKSTSSAASKTETTKRSKPAAAALGELYMELSASFDVDTGQYVDGVSDQSLAEQLGLSVEFVAQRRTADFGPLKVDQTPRILAGLKEQCARLRTAISDANKAHEAHVDSLQVSLFAIEKAVSSLEAK
jgi:hypothetical protein